jgi:hypothetical protein
VYFVHIIYEFRMTPWINSYYFLKEHFPFGFCNGDEVCFPWGTNEIFQNYFDDFWDSKGYWGWNLDADPYKIPHSLIMKHVLKFNFYAYYAYGNTKKT